MGPDVKPDDLKHLLGGYATGTLTPEELGPHDPALFKRVDANGDGVLSFDEVMVNKMRALKAGDTDGDGGLSFDEMVRMDLEYIAHQSLALDMKLIMLTVPVVLLRRGAR